ncbi:branched-chain amino acid transporter AzlC [Lactococcus hodotermopsidis]|uniref:Branched-chain amino acid transporter AzlC n=1 Tax=Pseudolactococcus hodotermopsidis TaxID=2709157 RepID=A0A6A0BB13_9LACT|nr:AzlC family ABC transporter permease [Lactococcus hodotermopsidis]GFH41648.1 branched-chain amino acid transporter AzlC [Lactococcus hodotermopsidis]
MENYKFTDGIKSAMPVTMGYISIGVAFGIVAAAQDFSVWQVFSMSVFLYAGAGQFIIAAMIAAHTPVSIVAATIFLVNFRMFLQSFTATQIFPDQSLRSGIAMGTLMTDESFGVLTLEHAKRTPITAVWMQGVNVMSHLSWVFATVVGAGVGNLIPNPQKFGIDYALTAMFVGLFILTADSMFQNERVKVVLTVILSSTIIYFLAGIIMTTYVAILIATVIGAVIGAAFTSPKNKEVGVV